MMRTKSTHEYSFARSFEIVRSVPPKPSITAFAEGNSALDVKLQAGSMIEQAKPKQNF